MPRAHRPRLPSGDMALNEEEFTELRQQWLRDRARLETRIIEQRRQIDELSILIGAKLSRYKELTSSEVGGMNLNGVSVGGWIVDGYGKTYQVKSFGPDGFMCQRDHRHHWRHDKYQLCDAPEEATKETS